jgi:hypothetical protein
MIYIDLKYISIVGSQLRNFKKKKDGLYNCSCPVCGDSDKKKTKARGYFYQKSDSMFYKCHNCGVGLGIGNFLRVNFPSYYNSYIVEKYKTDPNEFFNKKSKNSQVTVETQSQTPSLETNVNSNNWQKLSDMPDTHYAKAYALNRNIPKNLFEYIFFTEEFDKLVNDLFPGRYPNLAPKDNRLVIPFYSSKKELIGLQGRSFTADKKLRYITIRKDESVKLIYGLDRFSSSNSGYVVEGPIDSMFLPNCLAASNSDLESVLRHTNTNLTLIFDNEPRNKEIVALMNKAILNSNSVCIWPKSIAQKDINDMILSGISSDNLIQIIKDRTFSGLKAQLEFNSWKKV